MLEKILECDFGLTLKTGWFITKENLPLGSVVNAGDIGLPFSAQIRLILFYGMGSGRRKYEFECIEQDA